MCIERDRDMNTSHVCAAVLVIACITLALAVLGIALMLRFCPRGTWTRAERRAPLWRASAADGDDIWQLRRRGHYIARYRGSTPTAAALTALAAPVAVRDVIKACRELGLEAELYDPWGVLVAQVDRWGDVRIDDAG